MFLDNDPLWKDLRPHDTRLLLPAFFIYIIAKMVVIIITKFGRKTSNTQPTGREDVMS